MKEELIAECTDYDFKEYLEVDKPKSWLKSVSAFANGNGGTLFFGVDDFGNAIGLKGIKTATEKISELIKTKIEPIPVFVASPILIDAKKILKVDVLPGQYTPYYYHSDGNRIAFVRYGSQSIDAPSYLLNELILKGCGQTYDSILTNEKKENHSFAYLQSKFLSITSTQLSDEDFYSFGLVENGFLTRAGLLLADSNKLRQSRIFCTRWNGKDKLNEDTVLNDLEIEGSILNQLDRALDFVKANTATRWKKEAGDTIYNPDYDEEAIQEALVNAIIHRDYNVIGAEVVVNIYDDRLEITSPGGMFSGKSIPSIVDHSMESKRRNPIIADLFHRLHLMNRRGSGLANITNKTNLLFKDDKNHVFYESDSEFFVAKIENANYQQKESPLKEGKQNELSGNEKKTISLIRSNANITIVEIASELGLSRSTIIRATNHLRKMGLLTRVGPNKNGRWQINGK